ncbi:MAG TPA: dihydroxyacetone kinase subunit DhaL [Ktedonobacteraceae bacterium]|jgi:dihydroxyacetone kinase-like protein|nr:dihydroxyacetone kinase subunit DhaL [Ktedonobacteraceae bacterium]
MTHEDIKHWLERVTVVLHEQAAYLTQLDSDIGDADHGVNLDRGFRAVREKLLATPPEDLPTQLSMVGKTLISKVGGASGPLYGTAFLRASGAVSTKQELTQADVVAMLEAFVGGVVARGKAQVGEKTMLDALIPALEAAKQALQEGASLAELTLYTSAAAEKGMLNTIPLLATKGRASYLGERSIGHQDPGATSSWLIIRSLAETCADK